MMGNKRIKALKDVNLRELLLEHGIVDIQYDQLRELMDNFSEKIEKGDKICKGDFEKEVYRIIGEEGNFHFCEELTLAFFQDNKWKEIFLEVYSHLPKFKFLMEQRENERI